MRATYTAFDGTVFDSKTDCIEYERDLARQKYYVKFVDPSLQDRAKHIIKLFQAECRASRVDDELLEGDGKDTRYTDDVVGIGVYSPSVVHVRDDLVDILIMRIRELEGKPVYNARRA